MNEVGRIGGGGGVPEGEWKQKEKKVENIKGGYRIFVAPESVPIKKTRVGGGKARIQKRSFPDVICSTNLKEKRGKK